MKNSALRALARIVLLDKGFDTRVMGGKGYLPGARLIAAKAGKENIVAVKVSQQREISFSRQSAKRWRTLHAVDDVVLVVPGAKVSDEVDVYAFKKRPLVHIFNRAWEALERDGRVVGLNMPVFIPVDTVSKRNVGHGIAGLVRLANWSVHLTAAELKERGAQKDESYIEEFRSRFAAENGVDVEQIIISITGRKK